MWLTSEAKALSSDPRIIPAIQYATQASIYPPENTAAELTTAQTVIISLLYALKQRDLPLVKTLLEVSSGVPQIKSSFLGVWLRDDFSFPRGDVAICLSTLGKLLLDGLQFPWTVASTLAGLDVKYCIQECFQEADDTPGQILLSSMNNCVSEGTQVDFVKELLSKESQTTLVKQVSFRLPSVEKISTGTQAGLIVHDRGISVRPEQSSVGVQTSDQGSVTTLKASPLTHDSTSPKQKPANDLGLRTETGNGLQINFYPTSCGGSFQAESTVTTMKASSQTSHPISPTAYGLLTTRVNPFAESATDSSISGGNSQLQSSSSVGLGRTLHCQFSSSAGPGGTLQDQSPSGGPEGTLHHQPYSVGGPGGTLQHLFSSSGGLGRALQHKSSSFGGLGETLQHPTSSSGGTLQHLSSPNGGPEGTLHHQPSSASGLGGTLQHKYSPSGGPEGTLQHLSSPSGTLHRQPSSVVENRGSITPLLQPRQRNGIDIMIDDFFSVKPTLIKKDTPNELLYRAIQKDDSRAIVTAVNAGADVNHEGVMKKRPLHVAASAGRVGAAIELVQLGAAVDCLDCWGETPLFVAAVAGHLLLAEVLVSAGANVNHRNRDGNGPLHAAARAGQLEVARLLLESGADLDGRGVRRRTPLHCAAAGGHLSVVGLLLDRGADPSAADEGGHTPLSLAKSNQQNLVAEFLQYRCRQ